jgi:hypothetical protein
MSPTSPASLPVWTVARTVSDRSAAWSIRLRYASPDEISGATLFLLDDTKPSFVTGHILSVDGGCAAEPQLAAAGVRFTVGSQDFPTSLCNSYGYKYSIIYLMRIRDIRIDAQAPSTVAFIGILHCVHTNPAQRLPELPV